MKNITVKLLSITPQDVVEKAISMPYNKNPSFSVAKRVICQHKHLSCAEHIVMSWEIRGVSRAELQEHMRHRIASPTVKSTRYTLKEIISTNDIDSVMLSPVHESDKQASSLAKLTEEKRNKFLFYQKLLFQQTQVVLRELSKDGYPNDILKYLLPESTRTSFVWTINLRSFINFLELRTAKTAHQEIRYIANKMREAIRESYLGEYVDVLLTELGYWAKQEEGNNENKL